MFSRDQFTVCRNKLIDIGNISQGQKSLRELANAAKGKFCDSKCHSSL